MGLSLHQHGPGSHGHSHGHGHSHDTDKNGKVDKSQEENAAARKTEQSNINVRAAFIHVIGDFIQSTGVFVAALVIYFKVKIDF